MSRENGEKISRRKKRRYKRRLKSSFKLTVALTVLILAGGLCAGLAYYRSLQTDDPYGAVDGTVEIDDSETYDLTQKSTSYDVLNVGDGEAILISYDETEILIDTGGEKGKKKLMTALKEKVKGQLDYLVITSAAEGRTGGIDSVLEKYEVNTCIVGDLDKDPSGIRKRLEEKAQLVKDAESTSLALGEGVTFSLLKPDVSSKDIKDRSVVTYLDCNGKGFLALSDAGDEEISRVLGTVGKGKLSVIVLSQFGSPEVNKKAAGQLSAEYFIASTSDKALSAEYDDVIRNVYTTAEEGEIGFVAAERVESSIGR